VAPAPARDAARGNHGRVTLLRRLDHVAILVRSTEDALTFYEGHLGLRMHSSEVVQAPHVRLTYLDAGNAYVQLVEPLDGDSPLGRWLDEHGEGLHHICFGVDDVAAAVASLSDDGAAITLGSGRGRVASFVDTDSSHGVRIECTEFDRAQDVDGTRGYLSSRTSVPSPAPPGS
jgi:methylmalonyl-CoA/ethylmalonyl-CoA epimerase